MALLRFIVGVAVATAGRQLYWLFVAAAGLIFGLGLAERVPGLDSELLRIVIGLAGGVIGAILAIVLQRIAVAVAGFLIGGYAATVLLDTLNVDAGTLTWVLFVVAGILGAVLVYGLFDWALIGLSSLAGAALITQALPFSAPVSVVLFLGLFVLGFVVQATTFERSR